MSKRLIIVSFLLVALASVLVYASVGQRATDGTRLMPLDDAYIHFQYAKQLAQGQPYAYNTGQAPTSGATSLLYPYLLAMGYGLGFIDLSIGLWAMLLGGISLFWAMWACFRLGQWLGLPDAMAWWTALVFGLCGSIAWHAMSGMETMLMMLAILWVGVGVLTKDVRTVAFWGVMLTVIRPEGGIVSAIGVFVLLAGFWRDGVLWQRRMLLLGLPLLALGAQPLLNALITGSWVATGNQSKSILASAGQPFLSLVARILENFGRMWWELLTGFGQESAYLPPFALGIVIVGLVVSWRKHAAFVVWAILSLLAITGAVSTLDNAFWHFKRYQMPIVSLFFPLAGVGFWWAWQTLPKLRIGVLALASGASVFCLFIGVQFLNLYAENVRYVYEQPYQMANWLRENAPPDALIAVHDVGLMRYWGERNTLDMVGLTTDGASVYWRNGVGSVAEFLLQHQPDYIASYGRGHGYGLIYLENTRLMNAPLAEFVVENWNRQINVALAGERQIISQPDWEAIRPSFPMAGVVDVVNVADVVSETAHNYAWRGMPQGFVTEVYDYPTDGCLFDCYGLEAGRRIKDQETFTLRGAEEGKEAILYAQVHAQTGGELVFSVDGTPLATRTLIYGGGRWYTVQVSLPAYVVKPEMQVLVNPVIDNNGDYMPYRYVLWQSDSPANAQPSVFEASYLDGLVGLVGYTLQEENDALTLNLQWHTLRQEAGDYRFFVHLYGDISQPPVAQHDDYPLNGNAPIGNWLLGDVYDTITMNVQDLPSGRYTLAIGFYNPYTLERLMPRSRLYEVRDGRLFLQEVEIGR